MAFPKEILLEKNMFLSVCLGGLWYLDSSDGCLELSVGCLDLSFGCLDLSFGCLNLSLGSLEFWVSGFVFWASGIVFWVQGIDIPAYRRQRQMCIRDRRNTLLF